VHLLAVLVRVQRILLLLVLHMLAAEGRLLGLELAAGLARFAGESDTVAAAAQLRAEPSVQKFPVVPASSLALVPESPPQAW
jgi:hypothetical protein